MGLLFSTIEKELTQQDEEIRLLAVIKLLHLQKSFVDDPELYPQLRSLLRNYFYRSPDEMCSLVLNARLELHNQFGKYHVNDEGLRTKCLGALRQQVSPRAELFQSLLQLADTGLTEDLFLVGSYLKNQDPVLKCGALEVFLELGIAGDLIHVLPVIADSKLRVNKLAQAIVQRFEVDEVLAVLKNMATSKAVVSRIAAIYALSQISAPDDCFELLYQLTHDPAPEVKIRATQALAYHPNQKSAARLAELQNDLSIEVCESAHRALQAQKQGITKAGFAL